MDQNSPFEVGQRYRNNLGEYEVLAVEGGQLTVRFDDGHVQDLDAATQTRILRRYQEEEARRNAPPAAKATKRRARKTTPAKRPGAATSVRASKKTTKTTDDIQAPRPESEP